MQDAPDPSNVAGEETASASPNATASAQGASASDRTQMSTSTLDFCACGVFFGFHVRGGIFCQRHYKDEDDPVKRLIIITGI